MLSLNDLYQRRLGGGYMLNIQISQLGRSWGESVPAIAITLVQCLFLLLLTQLVVWTFQKRVLPLLKASFHHRSFVTTEAEDIERPFGYLGRVLSVPVWIGSGVLCLRLLQLPEKPIAIADWVLGVSIAIALCTLIIQMLPLLGTMLDAMILNASASTASSLLRFYPRFRTLIPLLKRCLDLTLYTGTTGLICQYSEPFNWLVPYTNQVVGVTVIYFLMRVAVEAARLIIDDWVNTLCNKSAHDTEQQRLRTLAPICQSCCKYVIYFGATICAVDLLNVSIAPVLAAVGSLGVAFSLSSQNLVQDTVSGAIILFDKSYLVGDYIRAGRLEERPVEGIVENIELLTTHVRHPNGQLQFIRNSAMGSVVNYSNHYAYATVNVSVDPGEDLAQVYTLIEETGQSLTQQHPEAVMESTRVEGLESLSKNRVVIRTMTKVHPGQHQYIQRLLRQRLKSRFEILDQQRQAGPYAVRFSETGIQSLSTSERLLSNRQSSWIDQNEEISAQQPTRQNPDLEVLDVPLQGRNKKTFRSRFTKLGSLFQRAWHTIQAGRQK